MPLSKNPGFALRKISKARFAEEAIGHSEGLMTVLRLTQADLGAAEEALKVAKDLFAAEEFSRALMAAKKAEALAITLDERFNGYQKARKALSGVIEELRRVGLATESMEAVLGQSEEKILAGIWENGAFVPNYLEARVLVERAEREGRDVLTRAGAASNAIFLAELAIEVLVDIEGAADLKAFAEGATVGLEQALEDATRELAFGNIEAATRIAKNLEERANHLRQQYFAASDLLLKVESRLADLRGEGISTERLESHLEVARDMLSRGLIESGMSLSRRLNADAESLGETYRAATTGLKDAEFTYAQLNDEGFHSYEAETSIRDARKSIREGNFARALEHLQRAQAAFVRRRNVREALAKAIKETRERVALLQTSGMPFMPDVQEILTRAEQEFRAGNFSGSSEDLRIATLLLGPSDDDEDPRTRQRP